MKQTGPDPTVISLERSFIISRSCVKRRQEKKEAIHILIKSEEKRRRKKKTELKRLNDSCLVLLGCFMAMVEFQTPCMQM